MFIRIDTTVSANASSLLSQSVLVTIYGLATTLSEVLFQCKAGLLRFNPRFVSGTGEAVVISFCRRSHFSLKLCHRGREFGRCPLVLPHQSFLFSQPIRP